MVVVGMVIALGPDLQVNGELIRIGDSTIPLPARTVARMFPPFIGTAPHTYRYTAVVVTGLAALASYAVTRPWWAGLVALEALLISPVPWPAPYTPTPRSPVLEHLAELPAGAVFTVQKEKLKDMGLLLLAQTVHGKPVHDGGIHRRAGEEAVALFRENGMVNALAQRDGPHYPGATETRWGFENLKGHGFRYLLVPADRADAFAWAKDNLGEPDRADPSWSLWLL
jgi:hypothetical protein